MHRNRTVIRIFRRNSGTWKIVKSWFIASPVRSRPRETAARGYATRSYRLRRPRFHLVPDRLLRSWHQHRLAARLLDLLLGRRGEVVGVDGQLFSEVVVAEHPQVPGCALDYAALLQAGQRHLRTGVA